MDKQKMVDLPDGSQRAAPEQWDERAVEAHNAGVRAMREAADLSPDEQVEAFVAAVRRMREQRRAKTT